MKTRFCPSPTGYMHVGNLRTALFNYLFAKANDGTFLLRIEDTDEARSESRFTDEIIRDLRWLGIEWDEGYDSGGSDGPYRQIERMGIYENYYKALEDQGLSYPCFCSEEQLKLHRKLQLAAGRPPRYPGTCHSLSEADIQARLERGEKPARRFRVPTGKTVEFVDMVRGEQAFESDDIGDFIIQRQTGAPSFMFSNAIDDSLMDVTHAMRGEDHLTNTPRQLLILDALGMRAPTYGHISIILGDDRSPLSKRNGSMGIHELREQGYLPIAILNYLSRLGHHYPEDGFLASADLIALFDSEHLVKSAAMFDRTQLDMWQKESIHRAQVDVIKGQLSDEILRKIPQDRLEAFLEVMKHNIVFSHELDDWANVFFSHDIDLSTHQHIIQEAGGRFFHALLDAIENCDSFDSIKLQLTEVLSVKGKKLFQPWRLCLTGRMDGPELHDIMSLLPKDMVKPRIEKAIELSQQTANP